MAANVARDPEQRISAHAIFSKLSTPLPFSFPAPFYIVAHIWDLEPGTHTFEAHSGSENMTLRSEVAEVPTGDIALIVLKVVDCTVRAAGDHAIAVSVDGQRIDTGITLRADAADTKESEES